MRRDRTWLSAASVGAPAALVVYFSFNSGGFFPGQPALVAIVLALVLVLRVTLAHNPLAGISLAGTVAVGAFALLTGWTLISGLWSDAPGRALLEYDRALLYTLTLAVFARLPRRPGDLAWVVRLLAAAIVVVCAAGLTTRLAPDVWRVAPSAATDRLSYPLTYWNGFGVLAAIGAVLLVHLTTAVREPRAVRVLAAAASPIVVATIFYTFSRGAIAIGALGIVVLLAVSRPAGWPTGLAAVVPACAGVLLLAVGADLLASDEFDTPAGIDEGHRLALVVAVGALFAGGLRAALLGFDEPLAARRADRPRRRMALAWGLAAAALVVGAIAAGGPAFAERQYDRFVSGDVTPETDQRARLLNPGNNGRLDHWDVALARFRADPLRGDGAGTYQIAWDRERSSGLDVVDAHSLYLEVLAELGAPGLLLLLVGLGTLLGGLARLVPGPERGPAAALLAAGVVWALHAGLDWDWEMPATAIWLFAAGGWALAAPEGSPRLRPPHRPARVAMAAACLVLTLAPYSVARSQAALNDAFRAFDAGDCARTIDRALASLDATRLRPQPYELLAYCDARLGQGDLALRNLAEAVDRDPNAWEVWYGTAIVRGVLGRDPRPAARRAASLNPLEPLTQQAVEAFDSPSPAVWRRRGRELPLPFR